MSKRSELEEMFKGSHFKPEVIIVSVRWYLEYKLSYRDISRMMAERNISVDQSTISRWVQRYAPEFEKKWQRFAHLIGPSWRVDETYIKVSGEWTYLYRGVDKRGKSVVSHLSRRRTVGAAKTFLRKARKIHGRTPHTVTLDGYQASHRAVREFSHECRQRKPIKVRSSKYLNNLIEQDHRAIKSRTGPMLGFKDFKSAAITLAGVELLHRIRQGQFSRKQLGVAGKTAPEIWNAVLTA
jgi:transposase-like protein